MPIQVIAATGNAHKIAEFRKILRGTGIAVIPLSHYPHPPKIVEDASTLEGNAAKKARVVCRRYGLPALADDSGLFVPSLGNQPGVRSARYAGPDCDYTANNLKLLRNLRPFQGRQRNAYFATVVALALPGEKTVFWKVGKIHGRITEEPRGTRGFGYDPVFVPQGSPKTFAEMNPAQKNRISHRALALRALARVIQTPAMHKRIMNSLEKTGRKR